jgi:hypothetical protein
MRYLAFALFINRMFAKTFEFSNLIKPCEFYNENGCKSFGENLFVCVPFDNPKGCERFKEKCTTDFVAYSPTHNIFSFKKNGQFLTNTPFRVSKMFSNEDKTFFTCQTETVKIDIESNAEKIELIVYRPPSNAEVSNAILFFLMIFCCMIYVIM